MVKSGKIKPRDARFVPADGARPEDRVVLHSGSVRWNDYRKRWILLAGQIGGKPSLLGEVWYAAAGWLHGAIRYGRAGRGCASRSRQSWERGRPGRMRLRCLWQLTGDGAAGTAALPGPEPRTQRISN